MNYGLHPTHVEIDLNAFSSNLKEIRRWIGPGKKIIPIFKADAYGHGSVELSKRAISEGYNTIGVANLNEALFLRNAGIEAGIIVLGGIFEGEEDLFVQNRLEPVIYSLKSIINLGKSARKIGKNIGIHIKIDTGMRRLGILPVEVEDIIKSATSIPEIVIEGLLTHFSSAFTEDREVTNYQIKIIKKIINDLRKKGFSVPFVHAANSAGIMLYPDSYFDGVRPGIILYGSRPTKCFPDDFRMEPVMTFKTRIIQLKEVCTGVPVSYGDAFITQRNSRIATIPAGYADGYTRHLSNKTQVLIRGTRVPQVGTICMDLCMIDVTDLYEVKVGDEVVLFGKQGKDMISVEEVAEWGGTISYEIFCQIGRRVRREYIL